MFLSDLLRQSVKGTPSLSLRQRRLAAPPGLLTVQAQMLIWLLLFELILHMLLG